MISLITDSLESHTNNLVVEVETGASQIGNDRTGRRHETASLGSDHNAKSTDKRHAQCTGGRPGGCIIEYRSGPKFESEGQNG